MLTIWKAVVFGLLLTGSGVVYGEDPIAPERIHEHALMIKATAHVAFMGDKTAEGKGMGIGTRGFGKSIEGFSVELVNPPEGVSLEYMAHQSGSGDTGWVASPGFIGSRGEGRQLEGVAFRLTGPNAHKFDVYYASHVGTLGNLPAVSNGSFSGTRAESRGLESFAIVILPAGYHDSVQFLSWKGVGRELVIHAGKEIIDRVLDKVERCVRDKAGPNHGRDPHDRPDRPGSDSDRKNGDDPGNTKERSERDPSDSRGGSANR